MSFGGGASGKVDFPTYMKNFHEEFLSNGGTPVCPPGYAMDELLSAALQANSPFYGKEAYSPDADNQTVQSRLNSYSSEVDAREASSKWSKFVDGAVAKALTAMPLADVDLTTVLAPNALKNVAAKVADAVSFGDVVKKAGDEFESRTVARHRRAVAQFAAGMADVNAVMSSAFVWGLAMLEVERQREISGYELQLDTNSRLSLLQAGIQAQLSAAAERMARRDGFVSNGAQLQLNQDAVYLGEKAKTVDLQYKVSMAKIASKVEQLARDVELQHLDATYDFTLFQYGANFLASISGAPTIPRGPSAFQSVLGGALGGAAFGAQFGAPGALAGGVAGLLLNAL